MRADPLPPPAFETRVVHHAEDPQRFEGAIIPPIFQNSLFAYPSIEELGAEGRFNYTRDRNPTTDILEQKLAAMECGEQARCFGSGMGAISAAILSCVKGGDHVVAVTNCYGPTAMFLKYLQGKFGLDLTFITGQDSGEFERVTKPNTTLFYLESPSSLFFELQDFETVTAFAKSRGIATIADNSYASPYFQNPLTMGVDMVVHSATKYLGGHSDIVAGVAVGSAERMQGLMADEAPLIGAILDPFASWLMLRGIRTLHVRLERHFQTALRIAEWLEKQPAVDEVFYPALASHPQAALYRRQMRGASGLVSFRPKTLDPARIGPAMNRLKYYRFGCSWGGFESLALPAHWVDLEGGQRRCTVRLHVGLENAEDLIADLGRMLEAL